MKLYSKHILQYGQRGHSDLERNPVCRPVYTEERHSYKKRDFWNKYTMVSSIDALFGNKNKDFCKVIHIIGWYKLKSYTSINMFKYSLYDLLYNLHAEESSIFFYQSSMFKVYFYLKYGLYFQSTVLRKTINSLWIPSGDEH